MKRILLFLIILCLSLGFISAAQNLSVPLGHRVYDILASAELRGIITPLPSVKPYQKSQVIDRLEQILNSSSISEEEKTSVENMIVELTDDYSQVDSFSELLLRGEYASSWDEAGINLSVGMTSDIQLTHSIIERGVYDSRNGVNPYLEADISDFLSIYMNFGLRLDHLDTRLYLPNDFVIPSEARYDSIFSGFDDLSFYYGMELAPEVDMQFLDGNLQFRFGSVQRDWGVGLNNFMISGSARSFQGAELSVNLALWLNYQFIAGSLAKFLDMNIDTSYNQDYLDNYFFSESMLESSLDNNISAHRVEVSIPWNITLGIYESVLYRKRFELSYLNPLSTLMVDQISLGDFDNMLAGVDFQWRVPGLLRVYGVFSTTEMDKLNPSEFFTEPRNIMGFQGGIDISIPAAQFATLTLQYTNLAPFFYTHYPVYTYYEATGTGVDTIYDTYELMYVNEGMNLGYPLRPNSDEILLHSTFGFAEGWSADITAKYQRRSIQYGWNLDQYMIYKAALRDNYADKDFNANIFEQSLGIELSVQKRFDDLPITLEASYIYHGSTERPTETTGYWYYPSTNVDPTLAGEFVASGDSPINPDYDTSMAIQFAPTGDWSAWESSHAIRFAVYLWK